MSKSWDVYVLRLYFSFSAMGLLWFDVCFVFVAVVVCVLMHEQAPDNEQRRLGRHNDSPRVLIYPPSSFDPLVTSFSTTLLRVQTPCPPRRLFRLLNLLYNG